MFPLVLLQAKAVSGSFSDDMFYPFSSKFPLVLLQAKAVSGASDSKKTSVIERFPLVLLQAKAVRIGEDFGRLSINREKSVSISSPSSEGGELKKMKKIVGAVVKLSKLISRIIPL